MVWWKNISALLRFPVTVQLQFFWVWQLPNASICEAQAKMIPWGSPMLNNPIQDSILVLSDTR